LVEIHIKERSKSRREDTKNQKKAERSKNTNNAGNFSAKELNEIDHKELLLDQINSFLKGEKVKTIKIL
jgi:hypothetical protein